MATRVAPAIVTIYIRNGKQSVQANEKTEQVLALLKSKGLTTKQIAIVDVDPYPKLVEWLEAQGAGFRICYGNDPQATDYEIYPLIFIGDRLLGPWEQVKFAETTGILDRHLREHLKYVENMDKFTADEKKKRKSNSWLGFWWNQAEENTPQSENIDERLDFEEISAEDGDENDVTEEIEIEVWRTNWLWRQQKRVLRFSADSFMRVEPTSRAVRAVFKYDNVDSVVVVSDTDIVIRFIDDTEPQYIHTRDSATRESLLMMLMNRATMHSGHFVHVTDERKQQQVLQS